VGSNEYKKYAEIREGLNLSNLERKIKYFDMVRDLGIIYVHILFKLTMRIWLLS